MSQFILIGTNDINYNISTTPISLPDDYMLFVKNGYIAGIQPPTYSNNILQYDPNTHAYVWSELTLSTITGNNETSKGILWNDANDNLHMMSEKNGVYQITIQSDQYSLTPANQGNLGFVDGIEPNSILIKNILPNTISGVTPSTGYLYYQYPTGYTFLESVITVSNSGLVYWTGSSYLNVTGTQDGLYVLNKTGSTVVNITSNNGFLIASNDNITALSYPTESGEYMLNVSSQTGTISWKRKEIITNKVISISINSSLSNGEKLFNIPYSGDYMIMFNFIAEINIIDIPIREDTETFDDYLQKCPTFEIINSGGKVLVRKIFTGPLTYDYFSFTVIDSFIQNEPITVKWINNDTNIVTITSSQIVLNYIEMDKSDYSNTLGSGTGVIETFDSNKTILVTLVLEYQIDLINIQSDSSILFQVGGNTTTIHALPPVSVQYYCMSRIYNVSSGDTISLSVNNSFVTINDYNIIIQTLNSS